MTRYALPTKSCPDGGIGRRVGFKIRCPLDVRVQVPLRVHNVAARLRLLLAFARSFAGLVLRLSSVDPWWAVLPLAFGCSWHSPDPLLVLFSGSPPSILGGRCCRSPSAAPGIRQILCWSCSPALLRRSLVRGVAARLRLLLAFARSFAGLVLRLSSVDPRIADTTTVRDVPSHGVSLEGANGVTGFYRS